MIWTTLIISRKVEIFKEGNIQTMGGSSVIKRTVPNEEEIKKNFVNLKPNKREKVNM